METQLARWAGHVAAVAEPHPLGISPETDANLATEGDLGSHNTAMSFAYAYGRAAGQRQRLSMLDWGGGLGQYAVLARAVRPDVQLDYHCRDLPLLTAAGRTRLPADTFHDTDDEALAQRYDLVMASSSLQYVKDWRRTLGRLAGATTGFLYVTRQPFVRTARSFVVLQRPHVHGYRTEYPGWVLNRQEFLDVAASHGLTLHREFLIWERPYIPDAPEQPNYLGFLFSPRGAATDE